MVNTNNNYHPYLPALQETPPGVSAYGVFIEGDRSLIRHVADKLNFENLGDAQVNSIPSPWSRALQFMSALTIYNYPIRDFLVQQYRGFLAAIALSNYRNFPITIKLLDLTQKDFQGSRFVTSLNSLKPDEIHSLLEDTKNIDDQWLKPYIFYAGKTVLGMTNPATLVTPAAYLQPELSRQIPWIHQGVFHDPTDKLSTRERFVLVEWLRQLYRGINRNPVNRHLAASIIEELQTFESDLVAAGITEVELAFSPNGSLGVPLAPMPLDRLNPPVVDGAYNVSNVQVVSSLNPQKPLYLIDKQYFPTTVRSSASEIIVYGNLSLEAFNPELHGRDDALFWQSTDFFSAELYYLDGADQLPGTWIGNKVDIYNQIDSLTNERQGAKTILLPFNRLLKEYFTSAELKQMTTIVHQKQGSVQYVQITLNLPISGFGQRVLTYPVTKRFALKPENSLKGALPVLAMWPNVPLNSWKQYYMFVDISPTLERAFSIDRPTADSREFRRVFSRQQGEARSGTAIKALPGSQSVYQYWECKTHPTILSAVSDQGEYLGLMPLEIPDMQHQGTTQWTVGVDFGTSFTNISVKKGSAQPQWLELKTNLLSITRTPASIKEPAYRELFITEEFIKDFNNKENLPVATILTTRGWNQPSEVAIPRCIEDGRIYVPRLDTYDFDVAYIETNIKWEQTRFQEPFLVHLQRYISAQAAKEGIAQINWHVSYPSAFSRSELTQYTATWDRTLKQLHQITDQEHQHTVTQTESVAFAQFYNAKYVGVDGNLLDTICVDIGGGTSDVSVFRNNQIIYQTSLPYAGRNIFHRMVKLNPVATAKVFGLTETDSKGFVDLLSGENHNSALDNYLRANSKKILQGGYLVNTNKPENKEFRTLLSFAFGGLFYYIGLVQNLLLQDGIAYTSSVFIGGNGSRFLDWLASTGHYKQDPEVSTLLHHLMAEAAKLKPNPKGTDTVQRSDNPKEEVCTGLVCAPITAPRRNGAGPAMITEPVLGEACAINGQHFAATDLLILSEDWEEIQSFEILGTEQLEKYIETFNQIVVREKLGGIMPLPNFGGKGKFQMDDNVRHMIKQLVTDFVSKTKLVEKEKFEPESTFLLQLRCFVDILAHRWGRNQRGK